jgi:hypothetical protein
MRSARALSLSSLSSLSLSLLSLPLSSHPHPVGDEEDHFGQNGRDDACHEGVENARGEGAVGHGEETAICRLASESDCDRVMWCIGQKYVPNLLCVVAEEEKRGCCGREIVRLWMQCAKLRRRDCYVVCWRFLCRVTMRLAVYNRRQQHSVLWHSSG